ncbi:MAG: GTPase HflX [Cryomorphaceae bacterium]|nr:GTPase HflX [Cryomorphaceae bacterium]|tara:strand:- start:4348 stop:5523 length:1176 start_codon:yes stop_codon:yes gene_type:complete
MLERKALKKNEPERCILIGAITQEQNEIKSQEYINELKFLAQTAGTKSIKVFQQKLDKPDPNTFLGSGKMDEVNNFIKTEKIDIAIFDDELTPSQLKNIERILNIKVLDRTNLILDIFASRARTSYARNQVMLAQYEYLLPRLTRLWTHLERQKGGIGMRGPGETQIETDRRIIKDKISGLKKKLEKIDRQMASQRGNRGKLVRAALIGYTNVGKSTLMNTLSKSNILAENKLFATLDTTVRKIVIQNLPFLLADTVGFIRKLPTQLIESFKSTLDEVREADLLLHVVDLSHPSYRDHMKSVDEILKDIGTKEKPELVIFNKIDSLSKDPEGKERAEEIQQEISEALKGNCVFISATKKSNFVTLKKKIYNLASTIHSERYPYNSFLYEIE